MKTYLTKNKNGLLILVWFGLVVLAGCIDSVPLEGV